MNKLQENMLRFGTKNINEQDINVGRGSTIKVGNNEYNVNIEATLDMGMFGEQDLDFNLNVKDVVDQGGVLNFDAIPDSLTGKAAFRFINPDNLDRRIISDIGPSNISLKKSDPRVMKAIKAMTQGQSEYKIVLPGEVEVTVTFKNVTKRMDRFSSLAS